MAKEKTTKCSVLCNIPATDTKVCPGSPRYATLKEALGPDLLDGYYTIDKNHCFVIKKNEIKVSGTKAKTEPLYKRLLALFGKKHVTKEGF